MFLMLKLSPVLVVSREFMFHVSINKDVNLWQINVGPLLRGVLNKI